MIYFCVSLLKPENEKAVAKKLESNLPPSTEQKLVLISIFSALADTSY